MKHLFYIFLRKHEQPHVADDRKRSDPDNIEVADRD